jgi:hypothetical protein
LTKIQVSTLGADQLLMLTKRSPAVVPVALVFDRHSSRAARLLSAAASYTARF